jgi:hypothetical protein
MRAAVAAEFTIQLRRPVKAVRAVEGTAAIALSTRQQELPTGVVVAAAKATTRITALLADRALSLSALLAQRHRLQARQLLQRQVEIPFTRSRAVARSHSEADYGALCKG